MSLEKIVDTKSIDDEENRYVKIFKVYFPNGGYLYFKNCYIPIEGDYCECNDQNEKVWSIQLKEKKIKE